MARTRQSKKGRRPRGSGTVSYNKKRGYIGQFSCVKNGKRVRKSTRFFATAEEAQIALDKLKAGEATLTRTRDTVAGVVKAYIARGGRKPREATTLQRYNGLVKNIATIKDLQVDRVKKHELDNLYGVLRAKGLAQTTIFHVHSLLSAAFKWGKSEGLIGSNPFDKYPINKPAREKGDATALTVADAREFLRHLDRTKYGAPLLLALATGMRRGEIIGLRKTSLDLERKVVLVRESRYQIVGRHDQKKTKTGQQREVPLSDLALEALAAEEARRAKIRDTAGDAWVESGYVFVDDLGGALAPLALTNAFRVVAKAANLYKGPHRYSLHSLRHTAATWMLAAGMEIHAVSKVLGHTQTSTTSNVYGHVVDGRQRTAADELSTMVNKLRKSA